MKKFYINEVRVERMQDLMNQLFDYDNKWKEAIRRGENFLDCHHWQILASETIHDIEEEGLLDIAKESYSWERETIENYLECYREIASGAKI